jgi:hypothetical protein
MACQLTVSGVAGITVGGILQTIFVYGTAEACDVVNVTISCAAKAVVGAHVSNGAWVAVFPVGETGCACNSTITVYAECITQQCKAGPTQFPLQCREQDNCPLVTAKAPSISDCNPDGSRTVSFFYQFVPQGSPVGASLILDGNPTPVDIAAPTLSTFVLTYATTLSPGTHTIAYLYNPPNCGGNTTSFEVGECPVRGGCPKITFKDPNFLTDCRDQSRSAEIFVTIEPQGAPVDAQLVGAGGIVLGSAIGQIAPFTLSGTQNFPNGTTVVKVIVTKPAGCQGKTEMVDVQCGPKIIPPPGGDGGDGDGGWCFFGRVAIVLFFATAMFLLLVGLCLFIPYVLIAAAVAFVVAALVFALWWATCGTKCSALLLLWQVSAVGAAVAAFLTTCCFSSIYVAIGLVLAALAGFAGWIQVCRPSACKVLFELLWVFVTPVPLIIKPLTAIAPCGNAAVPAWIGVTAAALAIAWGAACASKA